MPLQIELWRKYIAWERANPLRTEDQAAITKRGMLIDKSKQMLQLKKKQVKQLVSIKIK